VNQKQRFRLPQTGDPPLRLGFRNTNKTLFWDTGTSKALDSRSRGSSGFTRPPIATGSYKRANKAGSNDVIIQSTESIEVFRPPSSPQKRKKFFRGWFKTNKSTLKSTESATKGSVQDDQRDPSESRHTEPVHEDMVQHASEGEGGSLRLQYLKNAMDAMDIVVEEDVETNAGLNIETNNVTQVCRTISDVVEEPSIEISLSDSLRIEVEASIVHKLLPADKSQTVAAVIPTKLSSTDLHANVSKDLTLAKNGDGNGKVVKSLGSTRGTRNEQGGEAVYEPSIEWSLSNSLVIGPASVPDEAEMQSPLDIPMNTMATSSEKGRQLTIGPSSVPDDAEKQNTVKIHMNTTATSSEKRRQLTIGPLIVPDEAEKQNAVGISMDTMTISSENEWQLTAILAETEDREGNDQPMESIQLIQPNHIVKSTKTNAKPSIERRLPSNLFLRETNAEPSIERRLLGNLSILSIETPDDQNVAVTLATENPSNKVESGASVEKNDVVDTVTEPRPSSILPMVSMLSIEDSVIETSHPPHLILERRRSGKDDVCISPKRPFSLGDMFSPLGYHPNNKESSVDIKEVQSSNEQKGKTVTFVNSLIENEESCDVQGGKMGSDPNYGGEEFAEKNVGTGKSANEPAVCEEVDRNSSDIESGDTVPRNEAKLEGNKDSFVCVREGTNDAAVCNDDHPSATVPRTNGADVIHRSIDTDDDNDIFREDMSVNIDEDAGCKQTQLSIDADDENDTFLENVSFDIDLDDSSADEDTADGDTVQTDTFTDDDQTANESLVHGDLECGIVESVDSDCEVSRMNGLKEKKDESCPRLSMRQIACSIDESALARNHPLQLSPRELKFVRSAASGLADYHECTNDKSAKSHQILSKASSMDSIGVLAHSCFDPTFGVFGVSEDRKVFCDICKDAMMAPCDNDVKKNPSHKKLLSCPCCKSKGRPFDDANVCGTCLLVLTFPTSNGNRAGHCPLCKAWIRINLRKPKRTEDEDFQERADGIKPDVEVRKITASGHCLTCNQDQDILVEGRSTCDSCFLALHAPLLYECKQCHGTQRIPFPLYRYQKTVKSFSTVRLKCNGKCQDLTRWRLKHNQVHLVPLCDAPWQKKWLEEARIRVNFVRESMFMLEREDPDMCAIL